jgi:hypothetical protein
VLKPTCGPADRTETGLDGQLTLAERMSGASTQPYNYNLEVVGQYVGEGADHQLAWQDDCAYYTTNDVMPLMSPGVQVIDVSDPTNPRRTANLGDPSLLQPWESLQVNHKRKLLAGVEAEGGSGQQPGFSIYDVSNCRHPRLKAAVNLPNTAIKGHAGNFTPDGKTFYGTDIGVSLYAIDITKPSNPSLITNWTFPNGEAGLPHYITPDFDGVLGYIGQNGSVSTPGHVTTNNGLTIVDLSQIQFRIPNPQVSVVSTLFWFDSLVSEVSVPVRVNGKPFLVFTDEHGSGGSGGAVAACAANLPPWGFVRLIDISDVQNPVIAAKLILEVEDPANCDLTENDVPSNDSYGYSSHDCGVDNPYDAKLIACSYHEAGVRVFDIHDPYHPQEIAYYKGAARGTNGPLLPGSSLAGNGG